MKIVCLRIAQLIKAPVKMRFRIQSSSQLLSFTMALVQLLAFTVCLSALVGRGAPFMDKKAMDDMQEKLKRLRDMPGFDPEEYRRYWDEMIKNDPRKSSKKIQAKKPTNLDKVNRDSYLTFQVNKLTNTIVTSTCMCTITCVCVSGHMERLKELNKMRGAGDNWEKMMENRPMFRDRMARGAEDVRSRLDEARRVNIEEMRQLQR